MSQVVAGELAQTPIGEPVADDELVCKDVPLGVLHDAPDEEKDAASFKNAFDTCRRHA